MDNNVTVCKKSPRLQLNPWIKVTQFQRFSFYFKDDFRDSFIDGRCLDICFIFAKRLYTCVRKNRWICILFFIILIYFYIITSIWYITQISIFVIMTCMFQYLRCIQFMLYWFQRLHHKHIKMKMFCNEHFREREGVKINNVCRSQLFNLI